MIKIIDTVFELLSASPVALEALRANVLNLSAYAEQIHGQVEAKTFKPVKKATIVVALSRLAKKVDGIPPLQPPISLHELSIKTPLVDITYDKTEISSGTLRSLPQKISQASFLTFTEGINEVTIIASEDAKEKILGHFQTKPKAVFVDLVGVSSTFSEADLFQPNIIYGILAILAGKRINIVEIVSTYTELTIIIEKNDLEKTVQVLRGFFVKV